MNPLNSFIRRIKDMFTPKRKQPAAKVLPQHTAAAPGTAAVAPDFAASTLPRTARAPEHAAMPEASAFSAGASVSDAVPAWHLPSSVDAAAINEALCTQCRRYANDIAAQEVL